MDNAITAAEAPPRSTSLTHPQRDVLVHSSASEDHSFDMANVSPADAIAATRNHAHGHDSAAAPSTRTNRFSLTFPVAPASKETSPSRSILSGGELELESIAVSPSEWLTAIAAQERRVLELKEELHKAEAELNKLKSQWSAHEAQKKRNEARKTTKLRPLSTTLPASGKDDDTGANVWLQHEMERRKVLMSGARNSSRRVFSGSKHARTLSLLAPLQTSASQASPEHRPRGATSPVKRKDEHERKVQALPRAATTPNLNTNAVDAEGKIDLSGIDKELLLKTGKKMAMDFKDGIWTFWEDLRQATVGEEAEQGLSPAHLRQQSSSQTLRTPQRGDTSARGSSRGSYSSRASADSKRAMRSPHDRRASPNKPLPLFDESADPSPAPPVARHTPVIAARSSKHAKAPSVAVSAASSDAFDAWDDSPKTSRASSATSEGASYLSPGGSQDSSPVVKIDTTARDPIPWPNITKFGPATLRRTASHLMSEWDKLSPPPKEDSNDYVETKASTELGKGKKQD